MSGSGQPDPGSDSLKTEEVAESTKGQHLEENIHRKFTMTEKGLEQFESLCNSHVRQIEKVWSVLEIIIKSVEETSRKSCTIEELSGLHNDINKHVTKLESQCTSYLDFLNRQLSDHSDQEMERFNMTLRGYRILVDSTLRKLNLNIQDLQFQENASQVSRSSKSSSRSLTSIATKKRAKAEALKASLKFAEDQAKLERKQAELSLQHAITEKESALVDRPLVKTPCLEYQGCQF